MSKKMFRSILILILIVALMAPIFATPVSAAYENTYKNTGNMRNDIIGVALTQVGYREGSNNYTKYGVWYGYPNSAWCGMFVSWCANQAGVPTSILKKNGIANPSRYGLSYKSGSEYTPIKGDLFFKKNFSHVGLVYYTEGNYFYTVEGNTSTTSSEGHSVMIRKRKISDYYFSSPNYSGSSNTSNSGCSHDYTTKVESNHPHKEYKICSKCNKKSYTGDKIANDSCKTCIQEACSHTFSDWTKTSDKKHARVCSKCELEQSKSHDWKTGKILKEPTCVDKGSQQLTCSVCNAESSKSLDATGKHDYSDFSYLDEEIHQKVCSVCDDQTTAKHTVSDNWQHDGLYHWTSCSDCGGRIRHQEHSFPDGCLSPCSVCGYKMENGHKGNGENICDDTHHWQTCIRCGQDTNITAHIYTADCDEICNGCGYDRGAAAAHDDVYHADETGHWRRCTSCQRVTEIVSHSPDQNAKEWESLKCTHCEFELRSSDLHVHEIADAQYNATTHWGTCLCGELLEPDVHSWDFATGTCTVCGTEQIIEEEPQGNFFTTLWNRIFK